MTTFQQMLDRKSYNCAIMIVIDGVAEYFSASTVTNNLGSDSRTRFCSMAPQYVNSTIQNAYRALLHAPPSEVSMRADPMGGMPDIGGLSFSLVDIGNYLTQKLRIEAPPVTYTTGTLSSSGTSVVVDNAGDIAAGSVIWVGPEAMSVTSKASNTLTVVRGYAGTDAISHLTESPVHLYVPSLTGVGCELKIVPIDASSATEEKTIGRYFIDAISWDDSLCVWNFEASNALRRFSRPVPVINKKTGRVAAIRKNGDYIESFNVIERGSSVVGWPLFSASNDVRFHIKIKDEIFAIDDNQNGYRLTVRSRNRLGTPTEQLDVGDEVYRVMVADTSLNGDFRFSPPTASGSRSSGTWTQSDHFVDIILNLLLSSDDPTTDYVSTNYNASDGNWASLPPGWGVGLGKDEIDFDAWKAVKARTPEWKFPYFYYGDESVSFGELVEKNFLKPLGLYFGINRQTGKITIVLPRIPTSGSASLTLGGEDILSKQMNGGVCLPEWSMSYSLSTTTGKIIYLLGPQKRHVEINSLNPYLDPRNQTGLGTTKFEIPGLPPDPHGFIRDVQMRRLFRLHKPQLKAQIKTGLDKYSAKLGDIWSVDFPSLPNLTDGTRGQTDVLSEVLETSIDFDTDEGGGSGGISIRIGLFGYVNGVNIGTIGPSAYVSSVSTNTATTTANRYTASNATGGLPQNDAIYFEVGDVCALYDRAGVRYGTTQTISSMGANSITLNGNFGGALIAGRILRHARYDSVVTDQKEHVFMGDRTTGKVGAASTPYFYGEP